MNPNETGNYIIRKIQDVAASPDARDAIFTIMFMGRWKYQNHYNKGGLADEHSGSEHAIWI